MGSSEKRMLLDRAWEAKRLPRGGAYPGIDAAAIGAAQFARGFDLFRGTDVRLRNLYFFPRAGYLALMSLG